MNKVAALSADERAIAHQARRRHRMAAGAFPKRVTGERRNAHHRDDSDHSAVCRAGVTRTDLTQCPGQRAQRGRKDDGACDIETPRLMLIGGRIAKQQCQCHQRQRRVDRKYPLPAEIFGQPAAEHRPAGGGKRGSGGPYADGAAAFFLRISRADERQTRWRHDRRGNPLRHAATQSATRSRALPRRRPTQVRSRYSRQPACAPCRSDRQARRRSTSARPAPACSR